MNTYTGKPLDTLGARSHNEQQARHNFSRLLLKSFALSLFIILPFGEAQADHLNNTIDLNCGKKTKCGTVSVSNDGSELRVRYEIDDNLTNSDYYILKTHVFAGTGTPKETGSPGLFNFHHPDLYSKTDEHVFLLSDIGASLGDIINIAAHAEVEDRNNPTSEGDLQGLADALAPYNSGGNVNLKVAHPGGDSYFNSTISNGGDFDGVYDGWCVDTDNNISPGTTYCTEMISSYDLFADNLVDIPYLPTGERTLDLVNWIINQDFTTQAASCVARNYTSGDIQRSIWDLLDPSSTAGLGTWSQCAADEIRNAAISSGVGFEPACGEIVALLQNPCGNTQSGSEAAFQVTMFQITMTPVLNACKFQDDTAWGLASDDFVRFKGGWGSYFNYHIDI